jgi:hypothetical protein
MPKVTVAGQSYEVVATFGLLRRIKSVHGYDLLSQQLTGLAQFLNNSEANFTIACEFMGLKTAEEQDAHAERCSGSDIAAMIGAVTEALKDFFRGRGEPEMVAAIEKQVTMIQESRKTLAQKIMDSDVQSPVTREILNLDFGAEMEKAMAGLSSPKSPVA